MAAGEGFELLYNPYIAIVTEILTPRLHLLLNIYVVQRLPNLSFLLLPDMSINVLSR